MKTATFATLGFWARAAVALPGTIGQRNEQCPSPSVVTVTQIQSQTVTEKLVETSIVTSISTSTISLLPATQTLTLPALPVTVTLPAQSQSNGRQASTILTLPGEERVATAPAQILPPQTVTVGGETTLTINGAATTISLPGIPAVTTVTLPALVQTVTIPADVKTITLPAKTTTVTLSPQHTSPAVAMGSATLTTVTLPFTTVITSRGSASTATGVSQVNALAGFPSVSVVTISGAPSVVTVLGSTILTTLTLPSTTLTSTIELPASTITVTGTEVRTITLVSSSASSGSVTAGTSTAVESSSTTGTSSTGTSTSTDSSIAATSAATETSVTGTTSSSQSSATETSTSEISSPVDASTIATSSEASTLETSAATTDASTSELPATQTSTVESSATETSTSEVLTTPAVTTSETSATESPTTTETSAPETSATEVSRTDAATTEASVTEVSTSTDEPTTATSTAVPEPTDVLIQNSGFEDMLFPWTIAGYPSSFGLADASDSHSDNNALEIQWKTGGGVASLGVKQSITITPGRSYGLSFWIRRIETSNTIGKCGIIVFLTGSDRAILMTPFPAGNAWNMIQAPFTATVSDETVYIQVNCGDSGPPFNSPNYWYLDDVVVAPVGGPVTPAVDFDE